MRGDLRGQVATPFIGRADVTQNQIEHGLVCSTRLDDLDRRDDQALLIDLGRERHRAGRHAAHVGVVGAGRHKQVGRTLALAQTLDENR